MKEELLRYKKKIIVYAIATGIAAVSLTGCSRKTDSKSSADANYVQDHLMYYLFLNGSYKTVDMKNIKIKIKSNKR